MSRAVDILKRYGAAVFSPGIEKSCPLPYISVSRMSLKNTHGYPNLVTIRTMKTRIRRTKALKEILFLMVRACPFEHSGSRHRIN